MSVKGIGYKLEMIRLKGRTREERREDRKGGREERRKEKEREGGR